VKLEVGRPLPARLVPLGGRSGWPRKGAGGAGIERRWGGARREAGGEICDGCNQDMGNRRRGEVIGDGASVMGEKAGPMWLRLKPRRIHARRSRGRGGRLVMRVLCLVAADRDGREEAQEAQGGGENWGPGQIGRVGNGDSRRGGFGLRGPQSTKVRRRRVVCSRSRWPVATESTRSSHSGPSGCGERWFRRRKTRHAPKAARLFPSTKG
jgi:hypothetical protein